MNRYDELKKIYEELDTIPYEEKNEWQKFLDDDRRQNQRRKKEIRKYEKLVDDNFFNYRNLE